MTVGIPFDHEIFRKIAYKACFKFRATAVSNSNEFDLQVARQWQGIGWTLNSIQSRQIQNKEKRCSQAQ